jgi:hypothetical protein
LENKICSGNYKQITKQNINTILADQTKYNYIRELLNQTRHANNNNAGDSMGNGVGNSVGDKIVIKNFMENSRLMDFQMLPDKLKQDINSKFTELFNPNMVNPDTVEPGTVNPDTVK